MFSYRSHLDCLHALPTPTLLVLSHFLPSSGSGVPCQGCHHIPLHPVSPIQRECSCLAQGVCFHPSLASITTATAHLNRSPLTPLCAFLLQQLDAALRVVERGWEKRRIASQASRASIKSRFLWRILSLGDTACFAPGLLEALECLNAVSVLCMTATFFPVGIYDCREEACIPWGVGFCTRQKCPFAWMAHLFLKVVCLCGCCRAWRWSCALMVGPLSFRNCSGQPWQ